jgi:hypothetical protein
MEALQAQEIAEQLGIKKKRDIESLVFGSEKWRIGQSLKPFIF